jgi:hypothetical protein
MTTRGNIFRGNLIEYEFETATFFSQIFIRPSWILRVDFHVRVIGEPGETIGYLDIAADRGETILAQKAVIADENEAERVLILHVKPQRILNSTEFRARMVQFGEIHISGIRLHVGFSPPSE